MTGQVDCNSTFGASALVDKLTVFTLGTGNEEADHIDFDAFAPELAPGVADEPVPGGLTPEQAATIIRATAGQFRIRAVTLATYTPDRDRKQRTLRLALSLIELLADYASDPERRPSP